MPITTTFTADGAGLLRTVQGSTTGAELLAVDAALLSDGAAVARLRFALHDFGDATELRATAEEARAIAKQDAMLAKLTPQLCVAIVAPLDLQFGMSRMWEVFAEGATGWQTAVFRDRPSAIGWLRERVPDLAL